MLTGQKSQPVSGRLPHAFDVGPLPSNRYNIELVPDLVAGQIAWCTTFELLKNANATAFGTGGCLGRDGPLVAPGGAIGQGNRAILFQVLTARVAAVRISNSRRLLIPVTNRTLPYGWKVAVTIAAYTPPALPRPGHPLKSPQHLVPLPTLTPLDSALKPIPISRRRTDSTSFPVRKVDPRKPPANRCSIRVGPLAGLTAVQETVLRTAPPSRIDSVEPGYLSCASVEMRFHGQPVIAAILLDARNPGRRPDVLPDTRPLPQIADTFVGPGAEEVGFMRFGFNETGQIIARRHGDAWLVIQGPRSLQQREAILDSLEARG